MNNLPSSSDVPKVNNLKTVLFGAEPLRLEDVVDLAEGRAQARLNPDAAFSARINKGADFLARLLEEDGVIYGVTTGYGDSCTVTVPASLVEQLPHQLYTFHGVGLGAIFGAESARAILAVRLTSLCRGYSGVSLGLLKQLEQLLVHDILPAIPEEGSVGASGDLTPLSYVAAVLCGEREVLAGTATSSAAEALAKKGLTPLKLRPKEGLALMNGTSVMTALACLAWSRANYLSKLCTRISAMTVEALSGNPQHFDETLFSVKAHPGQQKIAARLRGDLGVSAVRRNEGRLQDRYSLRCSPHVVGVLEDALPFLRQLIENELNSANDNPIIDAEGGQVLHGGHFYGGHIAFAMDSLKNAVANLADLLDRQVAQLVDPKFSHGLPANLSGASAERRSINHGLKALGIGTSAWTAEALKLTMPASVFSRSTESHNQDKVSMGTIAARDCLRVLQLTEQVAAAALLAAAQGLDLRFARDARPCPAPLSAMLKEIRRDTAFLEEDRRLDGELRLLIERIQTRHWALYPAEAAS
jgi:histidine ammonia-lyase